MRLRSRIESFGSFFERHRGLAWLVFLCSASLVAGLVDKLEHSWHLAFLAVAALLSPLVFLVMLVGVTAAAAKSPGRRAVLCVFAGLAMTTPDAGDELWIGLAGLVAYLLVAAYSSIGVGAPTGTSRLRPPIKRRVNSHLNSDGSPKRSYATSDLAQEVATRQTTQTGELMTVYRCASCEHFHVGHAKKPR